MTTADTFQDAVTLHMIRAEINVREFQRWMGMRGLQDQDHAMHCLLTECLGPPATNEHPERDGLAPRIFRLMVSRGGSTGCLYGYGPADAGALRETVQTYGDPAQCRILNLDSLATKAMPTEWTAGKRLGFEVRIRPVVRKANTTGRYRDEQDAFQQVAEKCGRGEMNLSREAIYAQWLADRLSRDGAAELDLEATNLFSFQRLRSFRKRHSRYVEGPDAVLRGVLTIGDPAAFASLLARGVGRHRSYGYGMLLLRPPGSRPAAG